jgi:hypothetical protein
MIEFITAHPILTAAAVVIAFAVVGWWRVLTTPSPDRREAEQAARRAERDRLPGL